MRSQRSEVSFHPTEHMLKGFAVGAVGAVGAVESS